VKRDCAASTQCGRRPWPEVALSRFAVSTCIALLATGLHGCTIKQVANPVGEGVLTGSPRSIALVQNTSVRSAALHGQLQHALERRGFRVDTKPMGTEPASLRLSMTYAADWSLDMTLLSYVQLDVYRNGVKAGDVVYDSRAGWYAAKFIEVDRKVDELVGELFPGLAPPMPKPEALR
jgi:hypothetical protein